jgi:lambda family phage portal protein
MIDGEAFTHFAVDDDSLKLRYLASDQIDPARTIVGNMSGAASPRIVQGIEVDAAGRRTAYWVLPTAPDVPWASVGPPVSVPPMDIAHLFEPRFPGQLRGLSPLVPVATRLLDLDALEDAALKKAQISCLFAGFIRDLDNASGLAGDGKVDPATLSIEPGSLRVLPGGADVTFTQPSDMQGIDGTLKHMARSACAGASVPYMLASGDLAETSFSSAQVGQQAFRRRIRAFQSNCLVGQVLAPIWRRFVLLEVLTGRIRAPDFERAPQAYLTAKFIFRGWPATDPLKAAKADVLELNARIRSRTEIIGENGRDVSDVDAEIEGDPSQQDLTATATAALAQPEPSDGNA